MIDTRVECALPQFRIGKEDFYFPVLECAETSIRVDPATGDEVDDAPVVGGGARNPEAGAQPDSSPPPDAQQ